MSRRVEVTIEVDVIDEESHDETYAVIWEALRDAGLDSRTIVTAVSHLGEEDE